MCGMLWPPPSPRRRRTRRSRRGFVLIAVLWILLLAAYLAVSLRVVGSSYVANEGALQITARNRAVASSGVDLIVADIRAARHLQAEAERAVFSNRAQVGDAQIEVTARNEATRVDLNRASADLLVALARLDGLPPARAREVASRIIDWRDEDNDRTEPGGAERSDYPAGRGPTNQPLQSLDEAAFILGDPLSQPRLAQNVTVCSGLEGVRFVDADPQLLLGLPTIDASTANIVRAYQRGQATRRQFLEALQAVPENATNLSPCWQVTIKVTFAGGGQQEVRALVWVGDADPGGYRVMDWRRVGE